MNFLLKSICCVFSLLLVSCHYSYEGNEEEGVVGSEIEYKLAPSILGKEIVEAQVDFVSPPFRANNEFNVWYEISIVNSFKDSLTLNSIDVVNAVDGAELIKSFDENYLRRNYIHLGRQSASGNLVIGPGQKGVVALRMTFSEALEIPNIVFHRLRFGAVSRDGAIVELTFEVALIEIPAPNSISLGLPFRKGKWFYTAESHKDTRLISQGSPSYAQRYAIDWAYLEDDGVFVKGDLEDNKSYPAYGQEILAVADGVVKEIKDGFPDNIPGQINIKITRETICGNYLVLDIGGGVNAVYAHFIPDSFKVEVGEKIEKGQLIGYLGNSGNSDGPHLHFHLETKSSVALGGEGIPYHFEKFRQLKSFSYEDLATMFGGDKLDLSDSVNEIRLNEWPIRNGVVEFE